MNSIDSDLLKYVSAFQLAVSKHDEAKQTREDSTTPYWVHPLRVVERLKLMGINDYEVLTAAILHDVVEDTDITLDDLTEKFGENISNMVAEVTHDAEQSIESYMKQLQDASKDGQTIKLADRWDNINELRRKKYSSYGNKPPLQYIQETFSILEACSSGNARLAKLLEDEVKLAQATFA